MLNTVLSLLSKTAQLISITRELLDLKSDYTKHYSKIASNIYFIVQ